MLEICRNHSNHGDMTKGPPCILPVYEQRRVDLATFRALPASTWGHCSQVLCFTIVWDTPEKEKIAKWSPAPASILEGFNEIYVVYGAQKPYKTREKRQSCQIEPCLPPYRTPPPLPQLQPYSENGLFLLMADVTLTKAQHCPWYDQFGSLYRPLVKRAIPQ